jgi:hypothetical protein
VRICLGFAVEPLHANRKAAAALAREKKIVRLSDDGNSARSEMGSMPVPGLGTQN